MAHLALLRILHESATITLKSRRITSNIWGLKC